MYWETLWSFLEIVFFFQFKKKKKKDEVLIHPYKLSLDTKIQNLGELFKKTGENKRKKKMHLTA